MNKITILSTVLFTLGFVWTAQAEVVTASPDHFTLKLEAESELSPDEVWERLVVPSEWWQSDHTFSGDAANLSLEPHAGGLWREDWEDGSVWHGTVLQAHPGKSLSLSAPFGPLQGLAVTSVWTITITPKETGGTSIRFDHVTNGTMASQLDQLAPAVDFVKGEALNSLARPHDKD